MTWKSQIHWGFKMKRLHFFFNSKLIIGYGGVETWADYFFPLLSESSDYEIHIYYVNDKNDIKPKLYNRWGDRYNIQLHPIDIEKPHKNFFLKNYLVYTLKIKEYLKDLDSEKVNEDYFIHIGSIMSGFYNKYLNLTNRYYKRSKKVVWIRSKSVGEISQGASKIKQFIGSMLEKSIVKDSSILITNGYDTEKYYKDKYMKTNPNVECIPNVIMHNFLHININNRNKKNVVFAGRLHITKGFHYFEAISKLNNGNLEFVAYGDDSKIDYKLKTISYRGKYDQSDLEGIFNSSDIFLFLNLTSMAGGLSHSLLEAMSAGKIIVAWDNDIHSQVLNEKNAWLVPEGNTISLFNIINDIYENKSISEMDIMTKRIQAREDSKVYTPINHVNNFIKVLENTKLK